MSTTQGTPAALPALPPSAAHGAAHVNYISSGSMNDFAHHTFSRVMPENMSDCTTSTVEDTALAAAVAVVASHALRLMSTAMTAAPVLPSDWARKVEMTPEPGLQRQQHRRASAAVGFERSWVGVRHDSARASTHTPHTHQTDKLNT